MNEIKFKVLMHAGVYVDEPKLGGGIYTTTRPILHDSNDTISTMCERAENVRDLMGNHYIPDSYFENLLKCELLDAHLSVSSPHDFGDVYLDKTTTTT